MNPVGRTQESRGNSDSVGKDAPHFNFPVGLAYHQTLIFIRHRQASTMQGIKKGRWTLPLPPPGFHRATTILTKNPALVAEILELDIHEEAETRRSTVNFVFLPNFSFPFPCLLASGLYFMEPGYFMDHGHLSWVCSVAVSLQVRCLGEVVVKWSSAGRPVFADP